MKYKIARLHIIPTLGLMKGCSQSEGGNYKVGKVEMKCLMPSPMMEHNITKILLLLLYILTIAQSDHIEETRLGLNPELENCLVSLCCSILTFI